MENIFMNEALKEARLAYEIDEIPIGCVIVKDGEIVGRGHNRAESSMDPTCHAEILAIKDACKNLKAWRLSGCSMYVTLEPCSMCAGAIVLARIDKLYIGTLDPKAGACVSLNNITSDQRLNHQVDVQVGLMQEECSGLLKEFFKNLRLKKKELRKNTEEIQ